MSASKTGTRASTALHERHLLAGRKATSRMKDELEIVRGEGLLLDDEEFRRRTAAGESVELETMRPA